MPSLITILREVRDPREFNARHDLAAMLFIALAATLCGAKSCVEIAEFAEDRQSELAEIVDLPHGAPSHDSFSRVFRLLDPDELARALAAFAGALRAGLGLAPAKGVVAIDGKRLRRGYERGKVHMAPLLVSVWDAETRLSIAAGATPDGGNEVAMTLAALKTIALKGCVVTADALHCHPAMAAAVRERGGHYALKLKGNHGPLFTCAVALSRRPSPQRLLDVVRSHWSVENHLHRQLDIVFHEDDARTRKNHAPINLGIIRRMALDILNAHPDKRPAARKMRRALWDKEFFYELFIHLR
jgi:predicted transposase YbfD/YdcC